MDADVVVIGLGAAGSYAAWNLACNGASVLGLEAQTLVHDDGAYSGESRLFRAAYHEGSHYVPLLLAARHAWLELAEESRAPIFQSTGVLSIGSPDDPRLEQVRRSLAHADIPHAALSTAELRSRYPQHEQLTDEIAVLDELGGALRPESAVTEIQRRASAAGAELRGSTAVLSIEETAGAVHVTTADGTLSAKQVIVSAGIWTPQLLPELAPHLTIKPIALTWFAPENPHDFAPKVFPAFIRDHGNVHIFGVPTLDGSLVKAGYDAKWGDIDAPEQLERRLSVAERAKISHDIHARIPGLPDAIAKHSVHADLFTFDKTPIIGRISERITVGTGYSGHGFKFTPVFGDILADTALGRTPEFDISPFAPQRFSA
ncbi:N-methyl-L-tryptophan oxidase [Pseudoclavibacter sp. RFBJ3]|uniref:N-methyl-L-tryptophan oxidase n=1 Tax=unclassified Pseudoclavibacter TaxID=2615177 RepID=UPI000CE8B438|nr:MULTISPECIES: N-methyl-L-tryptophan oxidase [unclassified Pseudoclavibacter]PPF82592.1 N-methyl-L-tryptophan oxidase [Pseudoclavibacter sp. RFBJ5]PPF91485.1 N-methyl-L-tryptophan oxidase [Pseudoclavibacter sp. RFBJ3]PPF96409.1 N-methyl-L-tryptophan oxidase [Pseudoclavibacter sp. RFBH5]PPG22154.1 N-methyl-L-tryptophan oxidase [Pseudoclavibacter sp. RFBI4]